MTETQCVKSQQCQAPAGTMGWEKLRLRFLCKIRDNTNCAGHSDGGYVTLGVVLGSCHLWGMSEVMAWRRQRPLWWVFSEKLSKWAGCSVSSFGAEMQVLGLVIYPQFTASLCSFHTPACIFIERFSHCKGSLWCHWHCKAPPR